MVFAVVADYVGTVLCGRSKLRHMLQMSSLYRVQLILGKAKETDMHAECAILYGKVSTLMLILTLTPTCMLSGPSSMARSAR